MNTACSMPEHQLSAAAFWAAPGHISPATPYQGQTDSRHRVT